jgi:hypothetical protein
MVCWSSWSRRAAANAGSAVRQVRPAPGTGRTRCCRRIGGGTHFMAPVASTGMTDWATIASLATAGATLVLAAGTFASVRSANRAARTAERALLAGLRPVLAHSRLEDPSDKITWADNHWAKLSGGRPLSSSSTATSTWPCRCATSARASRSCRAGTRRWSRAPHRSAPSSTSSGGRLGISMFPPAASASGRGRAGWRRRLLRGPGRRHPGAAPVRH